MRILAFDLGKRRIGLALTDPLGYTAQGLNTFERTNIREDIFPALGIDAVRQFTAFER